MTNPWDALEPKAFWKLSMAGTEEAVLPWPAQIFPFSRRDRIATAGSCFAQNVAKYLRAAPDVTLMETETLEYSDPVYSGRYGNIYSPRQMTELLEECLKGTPDASAPILRRSDDRYVDVFRPFMAPDGFETAEAVLAARAEHLTAIRPIFTEASIFVFTLGLTEVWCADQGGTTGRAYPVCPGVYSDDSDRPYIFCNLSFAETLADTTRFLDRLADVNPGVRVILTVSPVPLTATASGDHVLTATMLSKSILRAVAGELAATRNDVVYFPSYEMVANPFGTASGYEENRRSVRPDIVAAIMEVFRGAFIEGRTAPDAPTPVIEAGAIPDDVICDDVEIEKSMGF
ncbi:GSCFA domain-containing protein [Pseudooctadecabacter jejudonensis]|uniref:GSCFA family protein n=1 Tax=Pseudooctadecabacter jejudonensis TaxID=1391910 RepID=A0A1Y5R8T5_9RHOB|nr:GSCFA domain-containing protein [Pseudooctadecabacter jejudonensis]SLN11750.1 GSCFA family protein [Pseudooctadecabacter jejudonensis]